MNNKHTKKSPLEELFPDAQIHVYKRKSWRKEALLSLTALTAATMMLVAVIAGPSILTAITVKDFFKTLPLPVQVSEAMGKTNIYAVNNAGAPVLLASYFEQDRETVPSSKIPEFVKQAAVSAEDKNFYTHGGVDIMGITRAALANYAGGAIQQGGSSITQQYAKNLLIQEAELNSQTEKEKQDAYNAATENSAERKIKEIRIALYLEDTYSKDEIVSGYLNLINFGGRVYGIKSAANYYYGVEPENLTLNQAATLLAIVNSPERYRIDKPENETNGEASQYADTLKRRDYILNRMMQDRYISQKEYVETKTEPITPNITNPSTGCESAGGAAYFCDYVTYVIKNDSAFGDTFKERQELLNRGGLQIYTTLNVDMQATSEQAMNEIPKTVPELELGASAVSVETHTGRILSMVQNKNYSNNGELATNDHSYTSVNYNTDEAYGGSTGFQTGSTFKIVTLLEWLNSGNKLYSSISNQGRITEMKNSCIPEGKWEGDYKFKNANGGYGSWGSVYNGTMQSLNSTFIGMAEKLDMCNIIKMSEKIGIHRADGKPLFNDPSMVIGTNEMSPLTMASAFGTVANGGTYCTPIAIDKILDRNGKEIKVPKADCHEALNPEITSPVNKVMNDIAEYGFAASANPRDGIELMAKTGTTDNAVDSWLVMSSTNVSTAIWVGNTIGKVSLQAMRNLQGEQLKYPLMKQIMGTADSIYGGSEFPEPRKDYLY